MAVDIKEHHIAQYQFPNFWRLHFLIKAQSVRLLVRKFLLTILAKEQKNIVPLSCNVTDNLEKQKQHFIKNDWAFIEDFFSEEFYQQLVMNLPPFYHYRPITHIFKSYDKGFIDEKKTYSCFPLLTEIKGYLKGDQFINRLNKFTDQEGSKRQPGNNPLYTRAYYQSSVIPHLDSVATLNQNIGESLNVLVFLRGVGGPNSGGTCILNSMDQVIFEPENLNNSCLIYRSDKLRHSVLPMKKGAERIAFGITYCVR